MNENEKVIRKFIEAWSRLDAGELVIYFTDDGVYYNMPFQPVQGRDNLENFIGNFIGTWTETQWDIITILSNGNLVIAERLDRTKAGEKSVDLPCVGVFENVYPAEVESVLAGMVQIAETAVIGIPDPQWGEVVCLVARLKENESLTLDEVVDYCTGQLAKFKIPKKLIITDQPLPRTPTGKILKRVVREEVSSYQ